MTYRTKTKQLLGVYKTIDLTTPLVGDTLTIDWSAQTTKALILDNLPKDIVLQFVNGTAGEHYDVIIRNDATGGRSVTGWTNTKIVWSIDTTAWAMTAMKVRFVGGQYLCSIVSDQASSDDNTTYNHTQANHWLTSWKAVYVKPDETVALAQSNVLATVNGHVIKRVIDPNTLEIAGTWFHTIQFAQTLTVGTVYFLSDVTAGELVSTAPTASSSFVQDVLLPIKDLWGNKYLVQIMNSQPFGVSAAQTPDAQTDAKIFLVDLLAWVPKTIQHDFDADIVDVTVKVDATNQHAHPTIIETDKNNIEITSAENMKVRVRVKS